MSVAKLSVSLSEELVGFVEKYRQKHALKRPQVFEQAVKLLRNRELETAYREANAEIDKAWEKTVADGLADEAWRDLLRRLESYGWLRDQQTRTCLDRQQRRQ